VKARAAVLEAFHQPLALREFEVQPLARGEVLVKIAAAGVCGSDVHMWHGQDPRTPLPLILGHEGVGEIADTGGERRDLFGRAVRPGDRVMWERARMCGHCYFCVVRKEPSLCPNRRTYGIAFSCAEPPHLRGCYAEYLHLDATGSHLIRIEDGLDPAALVAACCSGATAANAIERAAIRPGDVVLVIGPGPLGLFCAAMAARAGAAQVCVVGTARSKPRLELAPAFGATATLCLGDTTEADRRAFLLDRTHGVGPNVVLDCSGAVSAVAEFLPLTAPGGVYSLPGIAEPREPLPVRLFEWLARKSVSLQGVWVSDTRHLYAAIQLVLSGEFPFGKLVTHRFPLDQATAALEAADSRQAIKAVLEP
jgi:threonine dehydrogenase-like Zn-dependent dehydrogenase